MESTIPFPRRATGALTRSLMPGLLLCLLSALASHAQVSTDPFNPNVDGPVQAIVIQSDGKIVLGGDFSTVGGEDHAGLVRLNADGTIDPSFTAQVTGDGIISQARVLALALQPDGAIIVGGQFDSLGGQPRQGLGRVNANGSGDLGVAPAAGSGVYALALQPDGQIIVGGYFSTLAGSTRQSLGRLRSNGALDSSFIANVQGGEGNGSVSTLGVQTDGKIVVGGSFATLAGQPRNGGIGRVNSDGSPDLDFNPGTDGYVETVLVQGDGKILVGGGFANLAGGPRSNIGRLDSDGNLDTAFNPGASNRVWTLALQPDGKILAGGEFTGLGGRPRSHLGRLDSAGNTDTNFNPGANSNVGSLAVQPDGKILVGGSFLVLGGAFREFVGRVYPIPLPYMTIRHFATNGAAQIQFTNTTAMTYSVFASSDIASPLPNWVGLGPATVVPFTQNKIFQFTDLAATNFPRRFYQLRSP